jgi:hypothetical protein
MPLFRLPTAEPQMQSWPLATHRPFRHPLNLSLSPLLSFERKADDRGVRDLAFPTRQDLLGLRLGRHRAARLVNVLSKTSERFTSSQKGFGGNSD